MSLVEKMRISHGEPTWQERYLEVLKSEEWAALKKAVKEKCGYCCQRCGEDSWNGLDYRFQLHHKHYRTLGHETEDDVLFLCPICHEVEDEKRAARGKHRRERAQFRGFLVKKFGPRPTRWQIREARRQFNLWISTKN